MAKISFTKFNLKRLGEVKTITLYGQEIEIKQYLPVNDKIEIVTNVLQNLVNSDNNNFVNPMKLDIYLTLEMVYTYTNITFTDKQKEDAPKLYDLLVENGFIDKIKETIPEDELCELESFTAETIYGYYEQRNSVLGILEQVSTNYSDLNFDATEIQEKLADPDNLTLLKDVLTKLG